MAAKSGEGRKEIGLSNIELRICELKQLRRYERAYRVCNDTSDANALGWIKVMTLSYKYRYSRAAAPLNAPCVMIVKKLFVRSLQKTIKQK